MAQRSRAVPCTPVVSDGGHLHRTALVLAREALIVPAMIGRLADESRQKGEPPPAGEVDLAVVLAELAEPDALTLPPAAFLAGRCPGDELAAALASVVEQLSAGDHDVLAWGFAEAALSLALHGSVGPAVDALRGATRAEGAAFDATVAADHLAQLGDPSGWEVVVTAARSHRSYLRQKAVQATLPFHSYSYLDVKGLLRGLVDDEDRDVSGEARAILDQL